MPKHYPSEVVLRAVENVSDIVEITDEQGRFKYVNRAFEVKTGWSLDEALGKTPAELLRSKAHPVNYLDEIWETINAGETWNGRITSRARDGSHIIQEAFISPVFAETGAITHFVAIKRDITARVQLEAQLLEADRLAAVGQLAAGVAHEINNPLTYLLANLRFMHERVDDIADASLAEAFDEMLEEASFGARQIESIVRDLGAMTQRGLDRGPVDVSHALAFALEMINVDLGDDIEVVERYDDVPPVDASRGRLVQVFLSLLSNAVDAMRAHESKQHTLTVSVHHVGDDVVVEIDDTGCGIAPDDLDHIFHPFFSTRDVGDGTGLGLWVCYGIVKNLGGSIEADSEPGHGATFRVRLPAADDDDPAAE